MLSVRHHLYSDVCSGVSISAYSCTGLQPVALIMPCVSLASGVSPYQLDFQGFPSASWRFTCFPSSLTLWPARTKKPFTNAPRTSTGLLTIHPHASSEEMSMEKKLLIVVDLTVPCFLGDHSGSDHEWKLTTDERATSSYSFASALWKLLCRSVLIVDLLQKKGTQSLTADLCEIKKWTEGQRCLKGITSQNEMENLGITS